jgi:lysylphosphatidylglycerol synthetase-like protein (DUF2156 family)
VLAVFGAGSFARANVNPNMKSIYIIYAVLMFGDAIAMLVCGFYISKRIKATYWFAVIVLSLNIVLTAFDQIGMVDLFFSLLNFFTLIFLLFLRKELLPQ